MVNVILFRAQPFHNGHMAIVKKAYLDSIAHQCPLYIFIGSANKYNTMRNPLNITLRHSLIAQSLVEEGLITHIELFNNSGLIHLVDLKDLSDEANNTHSWGEYLFHSIIRHTNDPDITFWYTDNPTIMLSWFGPAEAEHIRYKFLPRTDDICATKVREAILKQDWDAVHDMVPHAVYREKDKIYETLKLIYEQGDFEK